VTEEEIEAADRLWEEKQKHCKFCTPEFDEQLCTSLAVFRDSIEVRKRWPRFSGTCSECGFTGVRYASYPHYIWGDW
jgi:hypothetical protein